MSPRPLKPRRCGCPYGRNAFKPTQVPMGRLEKIHLAQDELESMRLCDLLGLSQEDAGKRMDVSRGTVQRLVTRARKKVARALVESCALIMTGKENGK
ncbi:MAG: DUF134 domain-containing protein [Elusimicrobia bacterium]|nr:DUF134 domain-containing protein [Elusimicrobiota bacterium]